MTDKGYVYNLLQTSQYYMIQIQKEQGLGGNIPQITTDFPYLLQSDKLLVKMPTFQVLRQELRWSLKYLTDHQLLQSSKWAGELLLGVTPEEDLESSFLLKSFIANNTDSHYKFQPISRDFPEAISDILTVARTLFELRQYRKCAELLKLPLQRHPNNQSVIFFHYYSLWMAGLIRKEEQAYENEGSSTPPTNPELQMLQRDLRLRYKRGSLSDINLYLYGLVLKEQQRLEEARGVFIEVLNAFPCFWSCWLELCKIIQNEDIKTVIMELNDHWMKNFYFSSFCLEKYKNNISIEINYGLFCYFKNSNFIMNQIAHSFYNNQEFDISLEWFERLVQVDPYRFENMDTFSNILYIKENQGELANLALRCFYNNKYTPETCCVVGNYYSLMGEHLKAIIYFRKALKLDRTCLAAWTLMGHQYLQMKNISGAIEAYRSAVEIDQKDFRAWYGLGQTYELQNMYHYALYYFTRAVMSRPKDSRMWNAMATCYEKMDKKNESTKCFERAENCKDREGIAIHQLAKLYNLMGPDFESKAVETFELNLKRRDQELIIDKELGECLLFLSKYYKKEGNLEKALLYARRLYDFQGPERDEASQILQDIHNEGH